MKEKYLNYANQSLQKAASLKKLAEEMENANLWLEKAEWFEYHARLWQEKASQL